MFPWMSRKKHEEIVAEKDREIAFLRKDRRLWNDHLSWQAQEVVRLAAKERMQDAELAILRAREEKRQAPLRAWNARRKG